MTPSAEKIVEDFDNHHARCFATDGEYTDTEMVAIMSKVIKEIVEWDRNYLIASLTSTRRQVIEECIEMINKEKATWGGKFQTNIAVGAIAGLSSLQQALQDKLK